MHTFRDGDHRYAIPIDDVLEGSGGYLPAEYDEEEEEDDGTESGGDDEEEEEEDDDDGMLLEGTTDNGHTLPEAEAFVEGVVGGSEDGEVIVANIGTDPVEDRTIELRDDTGQVHRRNVSLDPLEVKMYQVDELELPVTLDTGDIERGTDW